VFRAFDPQKAFTHTQKNGLKLIVFKKETQLDITCGLNNDPIVKKRDLKVIQKIPLNANIPKLDEINRFKKFKIEMERTSTFQKANTNSAPKGAFKISPYDDGNLDDISSESSTNSIEMSQN
jgi:hypothetical protein